MVYFLLLFYHGLGGYKEKSILYTTRTPTWNIQEEKEEDAKEAEDVKGVKNKINAGKTSQQRAEAAYSFVMSLFKEEGGKLPVLDEFSIEACVARHRKENEGASELPFHINVLMPLWPPLGGGGKNNVVALPQRICFSSLSRAISYSL
jgi:hypothetical protein